MCDHGGGGVCVGGWGRGIANLSIDRIILGGGGCIAGHHFKIIGEGRGRGKWVACCLQPAPPIKIFNGCEVLIGNSVTRVTVRYHDPSRVMPNSYPSDGIFNLHRRTAKDSFSCILPSTIAFRLEYVLFYQFYAKITIFFDHEKTVRLLSYTLTSKRLAETDMKLTSKMASKSSY